MSKVQCQWAKESCDDCFKVEPSPSKKIVLFASMKAFKNDESAFYFILKALFVLDIFKFLSWPFVHIEKAAWLERSAWSKFMTSQTV